jgi:hypothetical protein
MASATASAATPKIRRRLPPDELDQVALDDRVGIL